MTDVPSDAKASLLSVDPMAICYRRHPCGTPDRRSWEVAYRYRRPGNYYGRGNTAAQAWLDAAEQIVQPAPAVVPVRWDGPVSDIVEQVESLRRQILQSVCVPPECLE
jgi:hypothetical protein